MVEPLLQTKLYIPITRSHLVDRPQLVARLNGGLNGKLTLVSAPAGFGKTTLVAHWGQQLAAAGAWQFGWLSLDENDNDVGRFFTYIVAALQKINGRFAQSTLELLQQSPADNLQIILTDLLNSLAQAEQNILLALDDYYQISNPAIHDGLQFLLDHAPPNFHLLLLSRADPPLPLARLRMYRQMTEIRQDDLRFAPAEARQFLNQQMALGLPETAVSALEQRTEGWIAGLQMAALSMQGHRNKDHFISDFTGSNRYIFDYLTEEVLAGLSPEIQDFLLQTAVLGRLCAPLCDALLEIGDWRLDNTQSPISNLQASQQILEQLEAANLFLLPLDDERRWYRYHQLFADLLRQQLRRERPAQESLLHRRASHWFEQANFTEEAIQHALAAADYERAASLVAHYSQSLVQHGEMNKLLSWIGRLPAEWRHQHPQLILNHAWILLFRGSPQEMEAILAHLPNEVASSLPYAAYLSILYGILATRRGNHAEAIALAEKAEAQLAALEPNPTNRSMRGVNALVLANGYRPQDRPRAAQFYQMAATLSRESGNVIAFLTAVRDRGNLLLEEGQLHRARAVFREGIQFEQQQAHDAGTEGRKLLAAAPIHVSLAQLHYEWNQLDEAASYLEDALRLLVLVGPVNQSEGVVALARLHLAQGNPAAVPPLLAPLEALQEAASNQFTRQRLAVAIAETACALYQHTPTAVLQQTLAQVLPTLGDEPTAVLAQARLLLALARPAEVIPPLEALAAQMAENGRLGLHLPALILLCLAQQQMGDTSKALHSLQQALAIAEPSGYMRLFVDAGEGMRGLLQTAVRHNIAPTYATRLLHQFTPTTPAPLLPLSPAPPLPEPLSSRETEVLQLIAQGFTNKQIAQKLMIAPSTAKRHTVNIYNKLGVANRAEATAKAYEFGLVNLT